MKDKKVWCNDYTLTPVCKWCLEEFLKMDSYYLSVNCCVFIDGKGGFFEPPDRVYLSQDYHGVQQLVPLFHELRHYYQFKTGLYEFIPENYTRNPQPEWDKQRIALERFFDYLEYPWEVDAREKSMEALRAFWKSPVSAPFLKTYKNLHLV
jgi:hypothetical protein